MKIALACVNSFGLQGMGVPYGLLQRRSAWTGSFSPSKAEEGEIFSVSSEGSGRVSSRERFSYSLSFFFSFFLSVEKCRAAGTWVVEAQRRMEKPVATGPRPLGAGQLLFVSWFRASQRQVKLRRRRDVLLGGRGS